jgi:DNA-binding transcriptional MerR regulator
MYIYWTKGSEGANMADTTEMNLALLAERSGVPGRTIRLYIAQGLLPGPLRSGRNAAYGTEHLATLERIRGLQREGLTLTQVRRALAGERGQSMLPEPAPWRQYELAPDLHVWVREDISPWRAKVIRDGVAQLHERLEGAAREERNDADP